MSCGPCRTRLEGLARIGLARSVTSGLCSHSPTTMMVIWTAFFACFLPLDAREYDMVWQC